jgi:hypothetical protein
MSEENPLKLQSAEDNDDWANWVKAFEERINKRIAETGTWLSKYGVEREQLEKRLTEEMSTYPQGKDTEAMYNRYADGLLDIYQREQWEKSQAQAAQSSENARSD